MIAVCSGGKVAVTGERQNAVMRFKPDPSPFEQMSREGNARAKVLRAAGYGRQKPLKLTLLLQYLRKSSENRICGVM
ncbi:hypothetical protein KCP69_16490 [Salmonella enterica subsp. enterica]|nr:hypothetical protein KCP69_16490 [Salmonella enterica subsp. enterica]